MEKIDIYFIKLYKIPQTIDIISFLENLHLEDNHRGINSLRSYIEQRLYYVIGATFITSYIIKNCANVLIILGKQVGLN